MTEQLERTRHEVSIAEVQAPPTETKERTVEHFDSFEINRHYFVTQAKEAMAAFSFPVLGVVAAASGLPLRRVGRALFHHWHDQK
jgi:hypothetical protein